MVATFGVQLSTLDVLLHFCSFFWPLFSGENRVFALLSLPDGPETRGVRRFFLFFGRNAGRNAFFVQNCCETRGANGLQIFCRCFLFFCLWAVWVFSSRIWYECLWFYAGADRWKKKQQKQEQKEV